jgi:hypothetical protein
MKVINLTYKLKHLDICEVMEEIDDKISFRSSRVSSTSLSKSSDKTKLSDHYKDDLTPYDIEHRSFVFE